jgi:TRAP-type C4-dicarboxylate transport system permease small subunit
MIASASLMAILLLTCLDVFLRYFFNRPFGGTYDLVGLGGAVIAAFAMPYTLIKGGHVAVDILLRMLSLKNQKIIETVTHIVGLLLFLILVWQCVVLAIDMKAAGEVTPTLLLPFYPIVYCMAICFFILCLAIIVDWFDTWGEKEMK